MATVGVAVAVAAVSEADMARAKCNCSSSSSTGSSAGVRSEELTVAEGAAAFACAVDAAGLLERAVADTPTQPLLPAGIVGGTMLVGAGGFSEAAGARFVVPTAAFGEPVCDFDGRGPGKPAFARHLMQPSLLYRHLLHPSLGAVSLAEPSPGKEPLDGMAGRAACGAAGGGAAGGAAGGAKGGAAGLGSLAPPADPAASDGSTEGVAAL